MKREALSHPRVLEIRSLEATGFQAAVDVTTPDHPLQRAEAVLGARIADRFRRRTGTLAYVRWDEDGRWPALEVRWDDTPAYMSRVMPYTIGVIPPQQEEPQP